MAESIFVLLKFSIRNSTPVSSATSSFFEQAFKNIFKVDIRIKNVFIPGLHFKCINRCSVIEVYRNFPILNVQTKTIMSNSLFRTKKISSIISEGGDESHGGGGLKRVLTVRDLTFFGIAAILGAGSFSSLGGAVFNGGPGVVILFVITAIACAFTAFCYSEFASRIPVAGSAYTYAYASFGELFAWIIGWALIMEYSIGNIYVAFSWSDYFTSFLSKVGLHVPHWLSTSYAEAKAAFINSGNPDDIDAWQNAPLLGSLRIILDLPALVINILITYLVFRGIKESRNFSNIMVVLKMAVVALVILVGGYFVFSNGLTVNWAPENSEGVKSFMPNGFSGVMAAVAGVFFAYIGFDAVSVLAEESKNPQRDLPKGMIYSLVICTVVYILLTLVLSGAVHYSKFDGVGDPLAFIFEKQNLNVGWMQFFVSIAAVIAMTSVLLVFQMGQPRIWMSMSRDGLLPPVFQKIHSKYKTPSFATIVTGLVVGIPILFTDKTFVLDFTSIATLFAFVLVCGGVLLIPARDKEPGKFHMPYINGQFIFPLIVAGAMLMAYSFSKTYFTNMFNFNFGTNEDYVNGKLSFMDVATPNISLILFWLSAIVLAGVTVVKKYSLIPLMGLITCMYLLTGMTKSNWAWFLGWLTLGLVIYFAYGYKRSKLAIS